MSIPSNISTELANLQKQLTAAGTLSNASAPTILALQLNCAQLLSDIDTALTNAAGKLDSFGDPTDPVDIINEFADIVESATDQSTLANLAGYVGRSNINLDQLL